MRRLREVDAATFGFVEKIHPILRKIDKLRAGCFKVAITVLLVVLFVLSVTNALFGDNYWLNPPGLNFALLAVLSAFALFFAAYFIRKMSLISRFKNEEDSLVSLHSDYNKEEFYNALDLILSVYAGYFSFLPKIVREGYTDYLKQRR